MKRLALFLALALTWLSAPAIAEAGGLGYWACESGQWTRIGKPDHPKPAKQCGFVLAIPETKAACLAARGTWARHGLSMMDSCKVPMRDADKPCADAGECEGTCLADEDVVKSRRAAGKPLAIAGRCAPFMPVFGCIAIVRRGAVNSILCLD